MGGFTIGPIGRFPHPERELKPSEPTTTHLVNQLVIGLNRKIFTQKPELTAGNLTEILSVIPERVKTDTNKCYEIFKRAFQVYCSLNDIHLKLTNQREFNQCLLQAKFQKSQEDDLSHVTNAYDAFTNAKAINEARATDLEKTLLSKKEPIVSSHVIVGGGDAATTLWLTQYREIPDTLVLARDPGTWQCDYILAQPYSLIDRTTDVKFNPSDFIRNDQYIQNVYVNARFLYQANTIAQAETGFPLVRSIVRRIQNREKHQKNWEVASCSYRIEAEIKGEKKWIYTNAIDICTGLGVSEKTFPGTYMTQEDYLKLSQYDSDRKFTPVVDAIQFLLTPTEESKLKRDIVIFGGGGSATASYRKAYFGQDKKDLNFLPEHQVHNVLWLSKSGLSQAGLGQKALSSKEDARKRGTLIYGNPINIKRLDSGKIQMTFCVYPPPAEEEGVVTQKPIATSTIEFDQLVSCRGLDASEMKEILENEFGQLELMEKDNLVTGMQYHNHDIRFYGGAASGMAKLYHNTDFYDKMRKRLIRQKVSADAEWPGTLPPSRANIRLATMKPQTFKDIDLNFDDTNTIRQFLTAQTKLTEEECDQLIAFILDHRKESLKGLSFNTLYAYIQEKKLNDKIQIVGHAHLRAL